MPETPIPRGRGLADATRKLARATVKRLASRRSAQITIGSLLLLTLVWLVPLQIIGAPGETGWRTAAGWPFLVLYGIMAASLLACEVPRITAVLRWLLRSPSNPGRMTGSSVLLVRTFEVQKAQARLRAMGYRRTIATNDVVWGVRNNWAPLGDLLFHFGILVLLAAWLVAGTVGPTQTLRTTPVEATPPRSMTVTGPVTLDARSDVVPGYRLESVKGLMVAGTTTGMSATVTTPGGTLRRLSPGDPLLLSPIRIMNIEGWGYAPTLSITASGTASPVMRTTRKIMVQHDLEQDDASPLLVGGRRYLVTVGLDTPLLGTMDSRASAYSGLPPTLMVEVSSQQDDGTYRMLTRNSPITLGSSVDAGPIVIRLDDVRAFAIMRTTRSWAMPLVALGLLCVLTGLLWRLVLVRREAVVKRDGYGSAVVVKADVYRIADAEAERLAHAMDRP